MKFPHKLLQKVTSLSFLREKPSGTFIAITTLILVSFLLFLTNYKPDSYLIGWDTIMPEFNFPLNFKRSLFSLWQDYRGLGTVDGLSHAANLMHTFYLWLSRKTC
jgi:hypothetical protein